MKINLGCGAIRFGHGWTNLDKLSPGPKSLTLSNIVTDLRQGIPLSNASVDWAYTSHFLEHLDPFEECIQFLRECRRVLRSGGVLRVAVPDFAKIARIYLEDPRSFYAEYGYDKPWFSRAKTWSRRLGISVMFDHKMIYDRESLAEILLGVGFVELVEVGADLLGHLPPPIAAETIPTHQSHTLTVDVLAP